MDESAQRIQTQILFCVKHILSVVLFYGNTVSGTSANVSALRWLTNIFNWAIIHNENMKKNNTIAGL